MDEVPPKDEAVLRGEHSVDPARGDEERLTLPECDLVNLPSCRKNQIWEEFVRRLRPRVRGPFGVYFDILWCRLHEVKYLSPKEEVIPNSGPAKVYMKIGVAARSAHKAVLRHARPVLLQNLELMEYIFGRYLCPVAAWSRFPNILQSLWPVQVNEVDVPREFGLGHQLPQRRLAELQRYHVQRPSAVLWGSLQITHPFL
mmetsp:Transcript_34495/g.73463  ORF Transcript_34495/g.73463 Transcript_34495/m.73463 type:complete len:200 (+) Transcript_34495:731-1330(+)